MKKCNIFWIIIAILPSCFNLSCKKYLDAKSDKKLVTISRLEDLQGLIDFYSQINQIDPADIEYAADNYYITDQDYNALPDYQKNFYVWNKENVFTTEYNNEWTNCYKMVYKANIILTNIGDIAKTPSNKVDWDNVKGQAYFLRARSFLLAVSIWSLAYDDKTANTDLGIPLRLDPDFNKPSVRASVEQTYNQIIDDLKKSIPLLPITPVHVLRSSRPAAYGLLARTYLFMREYDSCFKYANLCLQLKNGLLDYNTVTPTASYPFSNYKYGANPEIIRDNTGNIVKLSIYEKIDSLLYSSYRDNDLRKNVFFKSNGDGSVSFKGYYSGSASIWDGVATDEVYLMRAECYARMGDVDDAMKDLNTLLIKRWKTGTFVPYTADNSKDALDLILEERRKELVMRNIRWMDIKRLNKEGANITLKRIIGGQTYTLSPNDLRYALSIPENLVNLYNLKQNPR